MGLSELVFLVIGFVLGMVWILMFQYLTDLENKRINDLIDRKIKEAKRR